MSDESEVPLDLQRQIEALDGEAGAGYGDVAAYVEALPDDRPEECPDCGASLTPTTVFADGDGDAVAARLACTGTHDAGRVATYVYEPATSELYLEGEEQPKTLTGPGEDDDG